MAETVTDDQWPRPRGHGSIYPWDEWLDGQVHKLFRGEDFTVSPHSMVRAAHLAAKRGGKRVRTSTVGVDVMFVQAIGEEVP